MLTLYLLGQSHPAYALRPQLVFEDGFEDYSYLREGVGQYTMSSLRSFPKLATFTRPRLEDPVSLSRTIC